MKAFAALAVTAIALAPAASAQGTAPTRPNIPKTEAALACLLGMARSGCEAVFVGAAVNQVPDRNTRPITPFQANRLISWCADEFVHIILDRCPLGPLEQVQYLGANNRGDDVFDAKFMHGDSTFVISQPGADGKIPAVWRLGGTPNWTNWRELADLKAPAPPARTIYKRPQ